MSDFPTMVTSMPAPGVITSSSPSSLTFDAVMMSQADFTAGAVWPAANRAIYVPFIVDSIVTAYQMAFEVTVQSGNCDVGIYDELGNRVVSKGSTAVGAAGIQLVDITDTVLTPNTYYAALNVDNTTAAVTRISGIAALWLQVYGVQQQAVGAVTLPNPATFANPASAYLPCIAVALKSAL